MMRTASIRLDVNTEQAESLAALRTAYANACNRLVPVVRKHRVWNRVGLHQRTYNDLRDATPLGAQMCCNAIFAVCKAYKAQKELGRIRKDEPVPEIRFDRASVHFDKRTYSIKGDTLSLYTLGGRIQFPMRPGEHQRRILESGRPKEAELMFRKGKWFFNLVVESGDKEPVTSGPVMGVDVGENNLAAHSLGKVFGGEQLRDQRDRYLALRRRLQSNGSQSAKQKLRQVSGKEMRRVKHINHDTKSAANEQGRCSGGDCGGCQQDHDGRPDAHPRPHQGRETDAWTPAPLGVATVANLRRVQGASGRHQGRLRQSSLYQPDLLLLRRDWQARQASFRVRTLWSSGAQRLERESEPCPDWHDCRRAKGGCKYA